MSVLVFIVGAVIGVCVGYFLCNREHMDNPVVKWVEKEVPVERVKEVPVVTEVIKEVEVKVPYEVIKEVVKEVPVEKVFVVGIPFSSDFVSTTVDEPVPEAEKPEKAVKSKKTKPTKGGE